MVLFLNHLFYTIAGWSCIATSLLLLVQVLECVCDLVISLLDVLL